MSRAEPAIAVDVLAGLSEAQRRAATAVRGPVCVLAGAGTGKTRTITHRIAHQIAEGTASADEVLAVTFTDRAAEELRTRLALLGLPPVRAATFHAAAWAQLRHFWSRTYTEPLPQVLGSPRPLLTDSAARIGVDVRDLAAEIEWAKAHCLDPSAYASRARALGPAPAVAEAYAAYEETKAERGLIDYGDMLLWTAQLLRDDAEVAAAVRSRYRHFTVDEFQDVTPAQWALLETWLGERDDVCVVGDDAQLIYAFAGASPAYLTGFTQRFPHAHTVRLWENYRSSPQVLAVSNRMLTRSYHDGGDRRLAATAAAGPAPRLVAFDDGAAEITGVVAEIQRLLSAGFEPGEIAVCYRTNSQSQGYEDALRAAGVPYTVRGGRGFFALTEVQQGLRALADAAARGEDDDPAAPEGTVRRHPPPVARTVERILRTRLSWHPRREPHGAHAAERWRNLATLAQLAADLGAAGATFPGAVAELQARADLSETGASAAAVTLLTLHKAKGAEFDAVLLVGLEEGLLPISHATDEAAVAEERRLLYVGATRARRELWLSWARQRPRPDGRPTARTLSRFAAELGLGATSADAAPRRGVGVQPPQSATI